jgi:WD40 repeat protein
VLLQTIQHSGFVEAASYFRLTPWLATGSADRTVRITSIETGQKIRSYDVGQIVRSIHVSHDDSLLTVTLNANVHILHVEGDVAPIVLPASYVGAILLHDNTSCITSGSEGEILILNITTLDCTRLTTDAACMFDTNFALNRSGSMFASLTASCCALVWDSVSFNVLLQITCSNPTRSACFIATGEIDTHIAIGIDNEGCSLHCLQTGAKVHEFTRFHPENSLVPAISHCNVVLLQCLILSHH